MNPKEVFQAAVRAYIEADEFVIHTDIIKAVEEVWQETGDRAARLVLAALCAPKA